MSELTQSWLSKKKHKYHACKIKKCNEATGICATRQPHYSLDMEVRTCTFTGVFFIYVIKSGYVIVGVAAVVVVIHNKYFTSFI